MKIENVIDDLYANNASKLRKICNKKLIRFGGLSDLDYDDFYSRINYEIAISRKNYNPEIVKNPMNYIYGIINFAIKKEMSHRNRYKRQADRLSSSLEMPIGDGDELALGDTLASDFCLEDEVINQMEVYSPKVQTFLNGLTSIQKTILKLKLDKIPVSKIKRILNLSDKEYENQIEQIKSFDNIKNLCGDNNDSRYEEEKNMTKQNVTMTKEKSKSDKLSIAAINLKIRKNTLLFNHPLQRESEQWSPLMKGNLVSDILQGNPIPALVFAEQVINGIAITWDLDGKQRCTNVYSFSKDGFRISKNVERWMIEYQTQILDEEGNPKFDENNIPLYETKEFDIREKRYSELPEELQEKFNNYNFEVTQYLNCTPEDIAYHIARYNAGKPMTAPQKGILKLGEKFAETVKSITKMPFFKEIGGYKVSEFKNGTINRVVIESVMAANYLNNWKKTQEEMCEYIRENATTNDFEQFEDMVDRLQQVITDETANMFDSKDSFLWFGLFAKFNKIETDDKKFIEFMTEFSKSLHSKKINGVSFDDLNGRSTKDKNVVINKINHLNTLMCEFIGAKDTSAANNEDNILKFVQQNVAKEIEQDDIELYEDCLNDLTLSLDKDVMLIERQNHYSLVALMAYACKCDKDIYVNNWLPKFLGENKSYIKDQRENYMHMKQDFSKYIDKIERIGA